MRRSPLLQVCFGAMLVVVLTRASVVFEPFPGWDGQPLASVSAIVGLGPAGFLLLDVAAALLAAWVCALAGRRLGLIAAAAFVGGAAVVAHTLLFARGDAEPLPVAGAWSSGAAVLAAASVCGAHPAVRRAAVAIVCGFLCILLAKGAGQLLVEHPSVVAAFDNDPAAALADRGYAPGSPAALQFERRLRQPDITGWFGLSNVLAAYFAAGAVAAFATCSQARHAARHWAWAVVAALCLLCWAGVYLSGSKAGLALAAAGSAAFVAARCAGALLAGRPPTGWLARLFGVGLWMLPPLAIAARAWFLPHEGELSLLFRWFYLESAAEIAASNLPAGTGVDGFRAAYAMAKPPIAPETVTTAHNAVADWAAMLGLFGLPLIAVVALSAWRTAPRLASATPRMWSPGPSRVTVLCMALVLGIPVVASATAESAATLIELAVLRIVGLAAAVAVASAVWRLRPGPAAVAAGALVLLAHAQIDMLLFHPGSIPLALLVVGLALPASTAGGWQRWIPALPLATAIGLGVLCWSAWRWEAPLRRSFAAAQEISALAERGNPSLDAELRLLLDRQIPYIRGELRAAATAMPADPRAWLALSDVELAVVGPGPAAWDAAEAARQAEASARTLGRSARVADAIAQRSSSLAEREEWEERAFDALVRASNLDPRGPHFPALIAEVASRQGRATLARTWAALALELDANYALDPLAQLPAERRWRLEELVKGDAPDP